jgi:hypothetical protein
VPSFTINKKEFFLLWVKNYIICLNEQAIGLKQKDLFENENKEFDFMASFNLLNQKMLLQQIENIENKKLGVTIEQDEVFDNIKIWQLKSKEILDLKFILSFLNILVPSEFNTQMGSISNLKNSTVEDRILFDEII